MCCCQPLAHDPPIVKTFVFFLTKKATANLSIAEVYFYYFTYFAKTKHNLIYCLLWFYTYKHILSLKGLKSTYR